MRDSKGLAESESAERSGARFDRAERGSKAKLSVTGVLTESPLEGVSCSTEDSIELGTTKAETVDNPR